MLLINHPVKSLGFTDLIIIGLCTVSQYYINYVAMLYRVYVYQQVYFAGDTKNYLKLLFINLYCFRRYRNLSDVTVYGSYTAAGGTQS